MTFVLRASFRRSGCLAVGLLAGSLLAVSVRGAELAAQPSAEAFRFFEARVRPVLVDNCFKCHSEKKQRGGSVWM